MSDQQNVDLVLEVEKYPWLYNSSLSSYSRKADTDKAWAEIGKKLNLSDAECKRRWRNLRVVFTRHLKLPPIGSSGRKKKRYYLFDVMEFLTPFVRPTYKGSESGNLAENLSETADTDDDFDNDIEEKNNYGLFSEPTQYINNGEGAEASISYTKKRKFTTDETEHFVDCSNLNSLTSNDAVTSFLASLTPELKEMNLVQFKTFKRKVLSLIDDIMEPSASNFYAQHNMDIKPFSTY